VSDGKKLFTVTPIGARWFLFTSFSTATTSKSSDWMAWTRGAAVSAAWRSKSRGRSQVSNHPKCYEWLTSFSAARDGAAIRQANANHF
jgi:hypothetical protein